MIYVGAGSHASYYAPGEYLTELTLPCLHRSQGWPGHPHFLENKAWPVRGGWRREDGGSGYFSIPFVDYARGDGLSVGEGETGRGMNRAHLGPTPDWVSGYRGLWGLYARDPFEGEDAPAGPMYNRDKSVSRAWYDPVGWAGLDKVAPRPRRWRP